MSELAAFIGVALVVIALPGQDTALTLRNAVAGGRGAGVRTAAGVACGQAVWALAAALGVAALLVASEPAFLAVKLAGAAYLAVLGMQLVVAAVRRRAAPHAAGPPGAARALGQGLVSNLGNPKMAVFFTSLLPQFAGSFAGLLGYGLLFCAMTLAWLSAYAALAARVRDVLRRPAVRRVLDATTGGVLIALGIRLALTERPT